MTTWGDGYGTFVLKSARGVSRWLWVLASFAALNAGLVLVGLLAQTVFDRSWGFHVAVIAGILLLLTARYAAEPVTHWWVSETHFDVSSGDLICWHQAGSVRGLKRSFAQGARLTLGTAPFGSQNDLVLGSGLRRRVVGAARGVSARDYLAWTAWVRAQGWELDDAKILDSEPRLRPVLVADEHWTTLPRGRSSSRSPWLVPYGPGEPEGVDLGAGPWLPADNAQNLGEVGFNVPPHDVRGIAIRIGSPPTGAQRADFGGWATGVSVVRGSYFDDVECAAPVAGAAWVLSEAGELEITLTPVDLVTTSDAGDA